jgi:hypothetical protein
VKEIKQICYFSISSPFISTHTDNDTLTSPQMALYIHRSIFHLARLSYVRPETFGPTLIIDKSEMFGSEISGTFMDYGISVTVAEM